MKTKKFSTIRLLAYSLPLLISMTFGLSSSVSARSLPLEQISDPSCKALHWTAHTADCKQDFGLPVDESVFKSGIMTTEKLHFSVLYQGSYHDGHSDAGGHPGVDIVSAKGTPMQAIGAGEVHFAGYKNGFGNTVVIEHTLADGTTIYSNYAHMDTISVVAGHQIAEGEHIGTIGNTGFTIGPLGNHVDFQITTADSPSHPYAYIDCASTYMDAVQQGLCRAELARATIDPMEFLRTARSSDHGSSLAHTSSNFTDSTTGLPDRVHELGIDVSSDQGEDRGDDILGDIDLDMVFEAAEKELLEETYTPKITTTVTRKAYKPQASYTHTTREHIGAPEYTTSPYIISATVDPIPLSQGDIGKVMLEIKNPDGTPVSGMLDLPVQIRTNDNIMSYTDSISFIMHGKKQLLITGERSGEGSIEVIIGGEVVERVWVEVR